MNAANLIAGEWRPIPGTRLQSRSPANHDTILWSGDPTVAAVDEAVAAARAATPAWSRLSFTDRSAILRRFQAIAQAKVNDLAALIVSETGKVQWDSLAEAQLLASKVDITLETGEHAALRRVSGFELPLAATRAGRCWFRPHGVMAVLGPFNFPMHLPNGHIIPALAMGNTIVLKPSDKAPACGQALAELYHQALTEAGAPPGVVNLVHGAADVASKLASHADIDGVLFTGSWPVGRRIMEANLDHPGRMLALEMGGNNAAVVMPDADLRQALIECARSGFVTTGQRCTCTRRLIVHAGIADKFLAALVKAASVLTVGDPAANPPVFMGPIISAEARRGVLAAQESMRRAGATVLLESKAPDRPGHYLTPGIVRVDRFTRDTTFDLAAGADVEVFGPLLRVSVVDSLGAAIEQANATSYGLAASIFTRDPAAMERFTTEARAGCVNVNTGTAGASSKLPFGGLGHSGNHRPAGAFSLDYCAYPVAGMIESGAAATIPAGMTFDDSWL